MVPICVNPHQVAKDYPLAKLHWEICFIIPAQLLKAIAYPALHHVDSRVSKRPKCRIDSFFLKCGDILFLNGRVPLFAGFAVHV